MEVVEEDFLLILVFSKVRSTSQNTCAQIFCNRRKYTKTYPIQSEKKAQEALNIFIHEVCVPHELQTVGATTLTGLEWKKTCKRMRSIQLKLYLTQLGKTQVKNQSDKQNMGLFV